MKNKKNLIHSLLVVLFISCAVKNTGTVQPTHQKLDYFYSKSNQLCFYDENQKIVYATDDYTIRQAFIDGYAILSSKKNPSECLVINESFEECLTVEIPYVYHMESSDRMIPYGDFYEGFINLDTLERMEGKQFNGRFMTGFSEGYAVIEVADKCYYVDKCGKVLSNRFGKQIQYDSLTPFVNGLAVFGKRDNRKLRYGIIDLNGAVILQAKYDYLQLCSNTDLFIAGIKNGTGLTYGIVDRKGRWILQPDLYQIIRLDDVVWAIQYEDTGIKRTAWEILNLSDKSTVVLNSDVRIIRNLANGYVEYTVPGLSNGKGIMDYSGNRITEPEYSLLEVSGDCILMMKDNQWGIYSIHTQSVIDESFFSVTNSQ